MPPLDFIGAKDDGGGGESWSYTTYKAPVKSSPPTNQHPRLSYHTNRQRDKRQGCVKILSAAMKCCSASLT